MIWNNDFQVPPMSKELGEKVIETKLHQCSRRLQTEQHRYLLESFKSTYSPLYLKLALEEAVKWHSFTKLREIKLANSTYEMIENFFKSLETKYGPILVKKALSYLVAAK